MDLSKVLVFVVILIVRETLCEEVKFNGCDQNGFTCLNASLADSGTIDVEYECQTDNSTIYIWDLFGKLQVSKLKIKNCTFVQLHHIFCGVCPKNIRTLHFQDIDRLQLLMPANACTPGSSIFSRTAAKYINLPDNKRECNNEISGENPNETIDRHNDGETNGLNHNSGNTKVSTVCFIGLVMLLVMFM